MKRKKRMGIQFAVAMIEMMVDRISLGRWLIYIIYSLLFIISQIIVFTCGVRIASTLSETMVMYISSSSAQVVAALFGLIVTGFIFYDNRLSLSVEKDSTLVYIVDVMRKSFYRLLCLLSLFCSVAIIANILNILIYHEKIRTPEGWWNQMLFSESVAFTILSVLLIVLFVWQVVNPNSIKNTSTNELDRMNSDEKKEWRHKRKGEIESENHLAEFLKVYNAIDINLEKIAYKYNAYNEDNRNIIHHHSMTINLKILEASSNIPKSLIGQIYEVNEYRNYLVHGREMFVSLKMLNLAKMIYSELDRYLSTESNKEEH